MAQRFALFVHSSSSIPPARSRRLRLALAAQLLILGAALASWLLSRGTHEAPGLFAFFLYGIPCEFVVSLAPHEPLVLYVAKYHPPWIVALVAGAGTLVAEIMNYELLRFVEGTDTVRSMAATRGVRTVVDGFGRAPFAALWVAGFVPVIPFAPLRALALLRRYSRIRFLIAAVTSRTARFYLIALLGAVWRPSATVVALILAVFALGVTIPGLHRALARRRLAATEDGGS